jgi:hypothetical protein
MPDSSPSAIAASVDASPRTTRVDARDPARHERHLRALDADVHVA